MVAYFHSSINRFHFGLPGLLVRFLVLYLQSFGVFGFLSLACVGACCYLVYQTIYEQLVEHGTPTHHLSVEQLPRLDAAKALGDSWRDWQPDRKSR
jgi:hypothetical protein